MARPNRINMLRCIALFLALACPLAAADPADGVREAADGWRSSVLKQDKAGLDRYLSDDLTYIHSGGRTQSKAEYIAAVTTGPSHYESFQKTEVRIRVYGTVAVLSGYVDVKTVGRDPYRVRTLEIYKKNNGQWQLADKESVPARAPGSPR